MPDRRKQQMTDVDTSNAHEAGGHVDPPGTAEWEAIAIDHERVSCYLLVRELWERQFIPRTEMTERLYSWMIAGDISIDVADEIGVALLRHLPEPPDETLRRWQLAAGLGTTAETNGGDQCSQPD